MKIVKTIPEEEMVLEFVRAELKSPRFASRYHNWLAQNGIATDVDIKTLRANVRRELLWTVRPGLMNSLPHDIAWQEVLLENDDWVKIMYINEDNWRGFSAGTRLVQRGVEKLGQPNHATLTQRVEEMKKQILAGETFNKIILVAHPDLNKLVLLEGHVRATAYVASGIYREKKISAILGISEKIAGWTSY